MRILLDRNPVGALLHRRRRAGRRGTTALRTLIIILGLVFAVFLVRFWLSRLFLGHFLVFDLGSCRRRGGGLSRRRRSSLLLLGLLRLFVSLFLLFFFLEFLTPALALQEK